MLKEAKVRWMRLHGVQAEPATVHVILDPDKPNGFDCEGFPELSVRETRVRVRSAIRQAGLTMPAGHLTVTVDGRRGSSETSADLPVAVAILVLSGDIDAEVVDRAVYFGELSLTGQLRPCSGAFVAAQQAAIEGKVFCCATASGAEAMAGALGVLPIRSLEQLVAVLNRKAEVPLVDVAPERTAAHQLDWRDVQGHGATKRALEIAAAGGLHVLLNGSPGTGKTMLARRVVTILPQLADKEWREVSAIQSVAGLLGECQSGASRQPPFRAPHHTVSASALVGGGTVPMPGEVSLAHAGVLLMDELPEFPRHVAETLRIPLEDGEVTVTRGGYSTKFPSRFMLIAAMNPCPCLGAGMGRCTCTDITKARYHARLSAPLMNLIQIRLKVPVQRDSAVRDRAIGPDSATMRRNVFQARNRQMGRQQMLNGDTTEPAQLMGNFSDLAILTLPQSGNVLAMIQIAQSIADLDQCSEVAAVHVQEAIELHGSDWIAPVQVQLEA